MAEKGKSGWRQAIHNFIYGKVSRDFYSNYRSLLDEINYATVRVVYIFTTLLCVCLFLTSILLPQYHHMRMLYLSITILVAGLTIVVQTLLKSRQRYARIFYYIFAMLVFAHVIIVGTVMNPGNLAVTFFVMLMIIPLLYVEQPIYSVLMSAVACIAFSVADIKIKAAYPSVIKEDLVTTACCFVISAVFIAYIRNMNLHNMQAMMVFRTQSEMDKLTEVFNKAGTENLCKLYLENTQGLTACAMLVVDLDNFKHINDTFGHAQGDVFLYRTGQALKETFRGRDIVGRIGGDEFLVLMKEISSPQKVSEKAEQLGNRIRDILSDLTVREFTCSIGISLSTIEKPLEYHTMFSQADQALYRAKQSGKNRYEFYEEVYFENQEKPFMLVVDDTEVSRAILCSCFEEEYEILQAENGAQALEYMEKYSNELEVVLLDIEMPVMNGYQVMEKVQENANMRRIPILVITAYEKNELPSLELGAVDIITKPFDPMVVKKRVANARRKKGDANGRKKTS